MATAEKLREHYITCIICSDIFTDPTTLQCDHTFCRPCILKYTKTQPEAIQTKSIPCPVCKQMTTVSWRVRGGSVDQWICQLKPSRIMQGLVDDFGKNLEECEVQKRSKPFLCKTHEDEEVKLFCKDCRKAICSICNAIDHRNCKIIISFKENLSDITSTLLATKQKLADKVLKRNEVIAKRNSKLKAIQEQSNTAALEIKTAIQKAVDAIRLKEDNLMEKLKEIEMNEIQQLSDELNSDEMTVRGYQQQLHFIEKALKPGSEEDKYDMYEKYETDLTDDIIDISPPDKITFRWEPDSLSTAVKEIQIGHIYSIKSGDVGHDTLSVLKANIDTRCPKDKYPPDITDVAIMETNDGNLLVAVDRKNCSIKSFCTGEKQEMVDMLKLDNEPFGITVISKDKVLISLPLSDEFKTIWVVPKLTCLTTIATGRSHFGIHYRGNSTVFACRYPVFGKSAVDMADITGKLLRSFETGTLTRPKFVCESKHGILIASEDNQNKIIFTSPEDLIPTKTIDAGSLGLRAPRGISVTVTGDILVVGRNTNNVIQMSESGELIRELLTSADGLDKPRGICIDKGGLVYVTCGQYVKVFMFQ